jgi:hypothetical protein
MAWQCCHLLDVCPLVTCCSVEMGMRWWWRRRWWQPTWRGSVQIKCHGWVLFCSCKDLHYVYIAWWLTRMIPESCWQLDILMILFLKRWPIYPEVNILKSPKSFRWCWRWCWLLLLLAWGGRGLPHIGAVVGCGWPGLSPSSRGKSGHNFWSVAMYILINCNWCFIISPLSVQCP